MSGRRDVALGKPELELKVATRALIGAAGGTDGAGGTCHARQQRMSDCQNRNMGDFLRIDEVGALEDVTAGEGWPHVTRALARRQGFALTPLVAADEIDDDCLMRSISELTVELGDVARAVSTALSIRSEGETDVTASEAGDALAQLHDLDRASACLRVKLQAIRDGRG